MNLQKSFVLSDQIKFGKNFQSWVMVALEFLGVG